MACTLPELQGLYHNSAKSPLHNPTERLFCHKPPDGAISTQNHFLQANQFESDGVCRAGFRFWHHLGNLNRWKALEYLSLMMDTVRIHIHEL